MNEKNPDRRPIQTEVFLEAEMVLEVIILPTAIIPMAVEILADMAVDTNFTER